MPGQEKPISDPTQAAAPPLNDDQAPQGVTTDESPTQATPQAPAGPKGQPSQPVSPQPSPPAPGAGTTQPAAAQTPITPQPPAPQTGGAPTGGTDQPTQAGPAPAVPQQEEATETDLNAAAQSIEKQATNLTQPQEEQSS